MSKLLIGLVVCLAATTAFGGIASFDLPVSTAILPGTSVDIPITVTQAGATDGMVLFAQVTGPFTVTGVSLTTGTVWASNNAGLSIDIYDPQIGYASVEAQTPPLALQAGSIVAIVTVKNLGGMDAVGTISTLTSDGGSELGMNSGIGQALGALVAPEPVSAMLLLAGLPLLRRRRA